jgi:hypothetical protein
MHLAPRDSNLYFGLGGDEVYRRYFRTGPYTHLCLHPVRALEGGGLEVKWRYAFADLGLHFEIDRHFIVWDNKTILDVQSGLWSEAEGDEELRGKLFDHYRPFLRGVYGSLGVAAEVAVG